MVRIFLAVAAVVWTPYGLYLMFSPGALEGIAGVTAAHAAATTELRAMYGGLQAAIGVLCIAALLRERYAPAVLAASAVLTGGLLTGRLIGVLSDAGALDGYNIGALIFEAVATASAALLARTAADARAH
jgi:hypothetical protein